MSSRLKYSSALAAAAFALAYGAPGADATSFGTSFTGTKTYNAQTIALNTFQAVIQSASLKYNSSTGQGAAAASTFTIVWTTTGTGTTFTGALAAANVATAGCAAGTTVNTGPTVSGNTITLVMNAPAGGTGAGCTITLISVGAPAPAGLPVSVTGLNNLGPFAAAGTSNDTPSAVFGTFNTTSGQGAGTIGLGTEQDVITVAVTTDPTPANIDSNPQIASTLNSANSWLAPTTTSAGALVDLSGIGAPTVPAGMGFQKVANGVLSATKSASLGTITINNNNGTLDARFANACCNNSANTTLGNSPLTMAFNLNVIADLQTITSAYLRVGNNVNNTINGATPGVEQNPNANAFSSVCSDTAGGADIVSSPAPTAAGFQSMSFTIPSPTGTVNGSLSVNNLQYAVCVVTNGTNIIADTFANSPGIAGAGGGNFAGASTSLAAVVPGIATPIALLTNAKVGWDINYAGQKLVFPHVFNSSTGRPSSFRIVNTGVGTFPVYAVLQKDGFSPGLVAGGSIAAVTPFSAFYVKADDIVGGPGNLGLNNTMTLLTPAPAGSLSISHFLNDPNGDIVLVPPGL